VLVLDPKAVNQMATTLAVTKETAQMLRNAQKQGSLRPIYRAFEDGEETQAVLKALEKWRKNTNRAKNRP
jgi:Flp pilus assembly protein CpaB